MCTDVQCGYRQHLQFDVNSLTENLNVNVILLVLVLAGTADFLT
jgi:hypothetical protein